MRTRCTVCVKLFEMKVDYCLNLHTGLKCQRQSLGKSLALYSPRCAGPCTLCIICLVFPGRSSAFPSDAHPFSLHPLNCKRIFKFKELCYTSGGQETISLWWPLLHRLIGREHHTEIYTAQWYLLTNVCFMHLDFCVIHTTCGETRRTCAI